MATSITFNIASNNNYIQFTFEENNPDKEYAEIEITNVITGDKFEVQVNGSDLLDLCKAITERMKPDVKHR